MGDMIMAEKKEQKEKKEALQDIPTSVEEGEKAKKLRAAPDEVLAKALHDMMLKDQEQ